MNDFTAHDYARPSSEAVPPWKPWFPPAGGFGFWFKFRGEPGRTFATGRSAIQTPLGVFDMADHKLNMLSGVRMTLNGPRL
jgi:hypothetical protein